MRTTPYPNGQRLLIVTGEKFTPGTGDETERFQRLMAWTTERFPGVEIAYRWAAQDNSTTDQVPYVGLYDPRRLQPLREVGSFLRMQARVAGYFIGDRLRPSPIDSVDNISPGTGAGGTPAPRRSSRPGAVREGVSAIP